MGLRKWGFTVAAGVAFLACGPGHSERRAEAQTAAPAGAAAEAPGPLATSGRRFALLVAIEDYSASTLGGTERRQARADTAEEAGAQGRGWRNLGGAVRDAQLLREILVARHGFERRDIVLLADQAATRAAILQAMKEHLVERAGKGDVLLFYFSGHGSQVRNSGSDEPDKMDESLVPADSRLGVRDILDKDLRRIFNASLDRGTRLSVLLDSCHSGSGARGLPTGAQPRGVKPDLRDVADGSDAGPRPEDRGALVLAATADSDSAWEVPDEDGNLHGVFSWAWVRSLRDAVEGEPAIDTFLRAQARMRAETPYQDPIIAGNAEARLTPFLGAHGHRARKATVVAVETMRKNDGRVVIQGGWANGLAVGSQLRLLGAGKQGARLEVMAMLGVGRCEARVVSASPARAVPRELTAGALLEVVGWAAPPGKAFRVWTPHAPDTRAAVELARALAAAAARRGVRWVDDPTATPPTHTLRWRQLRWEVLRPDHAIEAFGAAPAASQVLARVPVGASLLVQIPAPAGLVEEMALGKRRDRDGVVPTERPEEADYALVGRLSGTRLEYAWVRPAVTRHDRSGLPERSNWCSLNASAEDPAALREAAFALADSAFRLRMIHGWQQLPSPPGGDWSYRLAIKRTRDGTLVEDHVLIGKEQYDLSLFNRQTSPAAAPERRYVYVFTIDSYGKSLLLFPSSSVENHFPLRSVAGEAAPERPTEIPFGPSPSFEASEPYGVDTYFLLSTDEPLPNPWILEWPGMRTRGPPGRTALEELLSLTGGTSRSSQRVVTPASWSIERVVVDSLPQRPAHRSATP